MDKPGDEKITMTIIKRKFKLNNWEDCVDRLIKKHTACLRTYKKRIIRITLKNQDTVDVGLGYSDGGFVHFVKSDGEPPYYITNNSQQINTEVRVFYFLGDHYTEISSKHIIPIDKLIKIVWEFYHDEYPDFLNEDWEEV